MLENLEPKSVFSFFEEIDQIPRGSGNTQKISDYLAEFAKKRNLFYIQDTLGNVIIKKDGTAGMEEKEPVIIQGHMDMVAVKEPDCEKDMETEGLDLAVQGDYVYAKGTSLGADDGIAVAYALALLDSKDIPHPPLEVIITVDEETGMFGAQGIDLSMLQGKKMLNIDSEKEDELTVACAGGLRVYANWQVAYTEIGDKEQYVVTVYGLKGGHSGVEIGLGRANANKLLCELLYLMERELDVRVITMDGGTKDNVIPHEAKAQIACGAKEEELKKLIGVVENSFREEWAKKESGLQIRLEKAEKQYEKAIDASDFFRVMSFFLEAPNGVQAMSRDLPGLVETSLNFATLHMEPEEEVKAGFSLRSSSSTAKQALKEKQVDAARKIQKPTFGSMELIEKLRSDEKIVADSNLQIELVGLCTGICVLSNAILCKAAFPEADVIVDAAACACVTPASHDTALAAMKLCQIEVEKEGKEPWRN